MEGVVNLPVAMAAPATCSASFSGDYDLGTQLIA